MVKKHLLIFSIFLLIIFSINFVNAGVIIRSPLNNGEVLNKLNFTLNVSNSGGFNSTINYSWNFGYKNYTLCQNCTLNNWTTISVPRQQNSYNITIYAFNSSDSMQTNTSTIFVGNLTTKYSNVSGGKDKDCNGNCRNNNELEVSNAYYNAYIYINITDLTNTSSYIIRDAFLNMTFTDAQAGSSNTLNIKRISASWSETSSTVPSVTGDYGSFVSPEQDPNQKFSMNITNLAKEWNNGSSPNFGLQINGDGNRIFNSSEAGTGVPFITTRYYLSNVNLSLVNHLANNSNLSTLTINFTFNISDDNDYISNASIYIDNILNTTNYLNYPINISINNTLNFSISNIPDGSHSWFIRACDSDNVCVNSSNFTITIDSTPPNINIITPTNNTNSTDINLNINYTTSDTHLSNCWYSNDTYSSNTSITCGENITTITWIQGNHNLTIWVNDTFGNVNSSQVSFFIDNIPPTLEIIYPEDGGSYSINSVSLNYTASDSGVGLSSCWYKNNTGSNITISCGTNTTINQPIDGTYIIYMWANDTLNNVVSHSHTWTISTSAPNVNLQKPDNNYWFNNQTNIYFNFTASDTNGIDTCRLYGNWTGSFILNESKTFSGDTSVNISEGFFVKNITDGFYKWGVWCNDTNNDGTFATLNRTFGIDTIYPQLNLSLPQNITYTTNQLTLNFSATDTNRNTCWYNINNTNNITLTNCNNISFTANQGGSILRLFVNDSANNVNSTNISFFVDSILPTLTITTNFSNASYLNYNNSIDFNLTIIDTNLNTCWYNINGSNQTFTCGTNLTLNVSEGLKTLIVYANDSLNNKNSSQISFTSDVTYPLIQNLTATPVGNTQNVDFSFNVTDTNYNNSFYTIFNSSGGVDSSTVENTSLTCTSGTTCSGSDTVSAFATFNLTIYSRDKSGNENSSTKSFTTTAGGGGGGGGGGSATTIIKDQVEVVALLKPEGDSKNYTILQLAIIYKEIFDLYKKNTGLFSILADKINMTELKQRLGKHDIFLTDKQLQAWISMFESGKIKSVLIYKDEFDKYHLILFKGKFCGDGICQPNGNDLNISEDFYNCPTDCKGIDIDTGIFGCFDIDPKTQCVWESFKYQYMALSFALFIMIVVVSTVKDKSTGKQVNTIKYYYLKATGRKKKKRFK